MSKHETIDVDDFRVDPGQDVDLADWPTKVKPLYPSKAGYRKRLDAQIDRMRQLQEVLYADDRYALLVIFQAMDAAGKDSAIEHVMSGVNPQGCQVFSFKKPSALELDHDFLWRTTCRLPERGRIGIFNRSYYEEVLVVRVHPELLNYQRLPQETMDTLKSGEFWRQRYRSINDLEHHLHANGTRIVKFYLHVSKKQQRKRFLERIDNPQKNWKFEAGDLAERERWDDYMHAYAACLGATSTAHTPWHVVPADDKKNARLIISQVLTDTLGSLPLRYPSLDKSQQKDLAAMRKRLAKD